MPPDKLGRFMRSQEFLNRANEAIARAVRDLHLKGIRTSYLDRKTGRVVDVAPDRPKTADS